MALRSIAVRTDEPLQVLDITDRVQEAVVEGITGPVTVFSQHTTAAITVNEAESRLLGDFEDALADLVPDTGWEHDRIDDNADGHVRAMLVGPSETVPFEEGELRIGTWQSILLVECDGPRKRTVTVAFED
ncbi:MAG: secondary thiamine-phosphate synthase enzyme YjbQ [Halodesulfurarchaeum sp.]